MSVQFDFDYKLQQYVNTTTNYKFIFEVTKLCGYGEFMTVFKNQTLLDLYANISFQFENREIKALFFINDVTNEKIMVPISGTVCLRDFISGHNSGNNLIIKPIYPMPCKVVYRLYLDDGHTHGIELCQLSSLPNQV